MNLAALAPAADAARVASDARRLTAVVRLATLRGTDTGSPTGREYEVTFTTGEQRFTLATLTGPDGYSAWASRESMRVAGGSTGMELGRLDVTLDYVHAEVRMTAPVSMFAPYATVAPGHVLTGIGAMSLRLVGSGGTVILPHGTLGGGGVANPADDGTTTRTYRTGSATCVRVGS